MDIVEIVGTVKQGRLTTMVHYDGLEDVLGAVGDRFSGENLKEHPAGWLFWDNVIGGKGADHRINEEIRDAAIQESEALGVPYIEVDLDLVDRIEKAREGQTPSLRP